MVVWGVVESDDQGKPAMLCLGSVVYWAVTGSSQSLIIKVSVQQGCNMQHNKSLMAGQIRLKEQAGLKIEFVGKIGQPYPLEQA